jgi:hypothetical protein
LPLLANYVNFREYVYFQDKEKRQREDFIVLRKKYRSHAISKGSLDVDVLLFRCFDFVCKNNIAMDPSDIEILSALENRLADVVYFDNTEETRKKKMEMLTDGVFSMLEQISPENCFFGIHPGDPGRIGFWPEDLRFQP